MNIIDCPRRAPLTVIDDSDGIVVHDTHTGSAHRLNGTAQHIWQLCDGTRDRRAIAEAVVTRFGVAPESARSDVDVTLAQFRDVGLIQGSGPSAREGELLTWAVGTALGTIGERPPGGFTGIDWNAVVHLSIDHGVMPLLFRCVARHWRDDVPSLVRDRLDRQYAANTVVVDSLLTELLDLLRQFEAQDVAAVPLKGPAMAQTLYGRAELRQAGDLDVFVPPDRAERARAILRSRGYKFLAARRTDAIAVRTTTIGDIVVDLQWALARRVFRFPVTLEGVWDRLTSVDVRGVAVSQPEPGDYLLILCAHASKHCWSSLIWIADLAACLRTWGSDLDWNHLLDRAAAVGGERQLLLGLRLANDVLEADLPAPVRERLRTHASLDALVAQVRGSLFAPSKQRTFQGSLGLIRGGIFYMRTRERIRDRVPYVVELIREGAAYLLHLVAPNHLDRAVVNLPRFLGFLYFGVRLVRVTMKWGAWLASGSRGLVTRRRSLGTG